jgi:tetratricopeptide (TPR) repeat protein
MQRSKYVLEALLLASAVIIAPVHLTIWGSTAFADEAPDALKKCDALASHPHDPQRYAPGVTDEQFAPGAAIEVCELAVKANPDLARAWFELGRSYWIGQRNADAFHAFVEAAKRNYAPAMKFIGDAYLTGRGLPSGQQQDGQTALQWYQKSAAAGFADGVQAVDEANSYLKKKADNEQQARLQVEKQQFDPSIFQNSQFMSTLYYYNTSNSHLIDLNNFDGGQFILYIDGFVKEMKEKVIFLTDGQSCSPLISGVVDAKLQMATVNALIKIPIDDNYLTASSINSERGSRDALALFNRYGCNSDVTRAIAGHLNLIFEQKPAVPTSQTLPAAPTSETPPAAPSHGSVPWGISEGCLPALTYLKNARDRGIHGAIAVTKDPINGGCGHSWSPGTRSMDTYRAQAMTACTKYGPDCRVVYEQ